MKTNMKIYAVCFDEEYEGDTYMSYHLTKEEAKMKCLDYFKRYEKYNHYYYVKEIEIGTELRVWGET
jgi:hypothetical protein